MSVCPCLPAVGMGNVLCVCFWQPSQMAACSNSPSSMLTETRANASRTLKRFHWEPHCTNIYHAQTSCSGFFVSFLRWNPGVWGGWRPFKKCNWSRIEIKTMLLLWNGKLATIWSLFWIKQRQMEKFLVSVLHYNVVCLRASVHVWYFTLAWSVICSLVLMNHRASWSRSLSPSL